MKIQIQRNETSQPLVYEAMNAYIKGNMYYVLFKNEQGDRVTHKFPMCSLFNIIEEYNSSNNPTQKAKDNEQK